jgi:uncharacterized protein
MNRVKQVNKVFLATVLLSILGSFIIDSWVSKLTDNYFIILLLSQLILIVPSVIYLVASKVNIATAIRFKKIKLSNIILIIVFAYLITPLMNLINAFSMMYVQNNTMDIMNNIVSNNGLLLSLFIVALIPSILEESVYRGIFYNEYSKISPLKGMLLSGFLFGIMHGNFNQFSYAFAMGVVFALLIEATDSILATMIVHFIINGTSIVLLSLYPKLLQILEEVYGTEQINADALMDSINSGVGETLSFGYIISTYGIAALIGTILAFIVYKTIAKNSGRWDYIKSIFKKGIIATDHQSQILQTSDLDINNDANVNEQLTMITESSYGKKRLLTISLVFGIIICIGLMIMNELPVSDAGVPDQPLEEFYTLILNAINIFHR